MQSSAIIINKILAYQKKKLSFLVAGGIINISLYLVIIWLSTLTADSVLFFSVPVRVFCLVFNAGLSLVLFYNTVLNPLVNYFRLDASKDLSNVAGEIGEQYEELQDRLKNVYQLIRQKTPATSAEIRSFAIEKFSLEIGSLNFKKLLFFRNYTISAPLILLILAGSSFLSISLGDTLALSAKRIFDPLGDYSFVPEFKFSLEPGNTAVILGQDLEINAAYIGPPVESFILQYKYEKESFFKEKPLREGNAGLRAELNNLRQPLQYRIYAPARGNVAWRDKIKSEIFTVGIIIPPSLSDLQVRITPPGYCNLPTEYLETNIGDITAYPGSKVKITARANKPVIEAALRFSDGSVSPAEIREDRLQTEFIVKTGTSYQFNLADAQGIENQDPIEYTVTVLEDLYPAVEVIDPGEDVDAAVDAALNITVEGNDDFGFSRLTLNYQIISSLEAIRDSTWYRLPLAIPAVNRKYFRQVHLWNFSTMDIGFEDALRYYFALADNDKVKGPKVSRTQTYMVRFPSLEQMFAEFKETQDKSSDELEEASRDSEELEETLKEISREMKREKKIDWERRKELESTLEKQEEIQEKVDQVQKEIDEAINKLQENQLLSREVLEKYKQLQDLFSEIATPELLQAMKNLQQAVDEFDQKKAGQALQQFKLNQEQFRKNLERTLELFKKVQLEQELDRLVQIAEKMAEEQSSISENIEQRENGSERLGQQQESLHMIEQGLDKLIQEEMIQNYPETKQNLAASQEMISRENMKSGLQQMKEMISSGQQEKAAQQSKDMAANMKQLSEKLQQAQKSMMDSDRKNIMAQMMKATNNLVNLSKDEENILNKTGSISQLSDTYRDLAGDQQGVLENTSRVIKDIIDISKQTFFVPPELNKSLGSAGSNMQQSLSQLENRNRSNARKSQEKAMQALNSAAMQMQGSMQNLAQSGSASGFDEFMKRLQQMAGQQGQINENSMELFEGGKKPGGLSAQEQARMQRMASEQRTLRQSLEQMSEEMGNRSDVLGRMDQLARDMEEVVKDLQAMQVDRETIERQQKILSRMIDAQKSVREKEYSKKRKAESGKYYSRKSPQEAQSGINKRAKKLTVDLLKALKEGYNPDYEKMIEEYFRQLNRQNLQE